MKNNAAAPRKHWIRPLPERLVNKIAAGEVIERPAAVLKELLENSLDAGSTSIDIVVEKSGTRSIVVTDNGCGIPADQVEIAFARHATSKIGDFSDLENLQSFGFRGEALPSIASVSRTRLVTRVAGAETAMEIIIEGGVVQSLKPIGAPPGTTVEVENLFFNTPARRKFLKAEATEARHLTRNATALALSAPKVRFSYTLNGRTLFALEQGGTEERLRTAQLLFGDPTAPLVPLKSEGDSLQLRGFVTFPDDCRGNQYGLYLFINNRYIRSQSLVHAVTSGYGELLPRGHYPVGAIFLELSPERVDVNVHPTKAEVRLSDEKLVHDYLYAAVKQALRGRPVSPLLQTDRVAPSGPGMTVREAVQRLRNFPSEPAPSQESLELIGKIFSESSVTEEINVTPAIKPRITERVETGEMAAQYPEGRSAVAYLGQFAGLYLVFKSAEELVILDQHAAHERILYEEYSRLIESGGGVSQSLLFPVTIKLSAERYGLYEESSALLGSVGFAAEPFGPNAVLLSAVPTALSRRSPEKTFLDILDDIEVIQRSGANLKKAMAQSLACRAAIMAGDSLEDAEALALYKQLEGAEHKHSCPHGRPTMLRLTRRELDARFARQ